MDNEIPITNLLKFVKEVNELHECSIFFGRTDTGIVLCVWFDKASDEEIRELKEKLYPLVSVLEKEANIVITTLQVLDREQPYLLGLVNLNTLHTSSCAS